MLFADISTNSCTYLITLATSVVLQMLELEY